MEGFQCDGYSSTFNHSRTCTYIFDGTRKIVQYSSPSPCDGFGDGVEYCTILRVLSKISASPAVIKCA